MLLIFSIIPKVSFCSWFLLAHLLWLWLLFSLAHWLWSLLLVLAGSSALVSASLWSLLLVLAGSSALVSASVLARPLALASALGSCWLTCSGFGFCSRSPTSFGFCSWFLLAHMLWLWLLFSLAHWLWLLLLVLAGSSALVSASVLARPLALASALGSSSLTGFGFCSYFYWYTFLDLSIPLSQRPDEVSLKNDVPWHHVATCLDNQELGSP
ncbi:hypothetical protein INT43_002360 [Umbelopsis isabellina]|uniref:Uncharacterized protein n=1 Tax=Mortierella isabellina TaxID=91625 RepID=A0A8H7Q4F0_MORIS|nr:hypothetical protein INT43_002360 [Umbelopsis isabellina]